MFHSHTTSHHDDRKGRHYYMTTSPTDALVYSSDDPCGRHAGRGRHVEHGRHVGGARHVDYNHHAYLAIIILSLIILASCSSNVPPDTVNHTPTPSVIPPSPTPTAIATSTPTASPAPTRYTSHVILRGSARPDDMIFDAQGRVIFSDFYNGTVSRINADRSVTVLLRGIAGPEGLVILQNGTMIIAEQRTNRILAWTGGTAAPTVLRALPGTPSTAQCKDGVDGIAFDATSNTIIVPDSPTGEVYRMSLDGKTLTKLASGIVRPVGAAVDTKGNIYVADECAGALWRIDPNGKTTRIGGFGMPDDVVIDPHGNLLVIDLLPSIHALIRLHLDTGKRETLASAGFIEPQGLLVSPDDTIYVSDDYANIIVEYIPA